ncbi:MAG: hypothetical protein CVU05_09335 [Bacteroidetes bacterium HGW-Bacteroidetes-21]|nr:MAG: hypothetical protein CVU05_09335 [Bacteroidetes bacterium HGW-Bacteroidetes-21]
MKKVTHIYIILLLSFTSNAQDINGIYEQAFKKIHCMLNETCSLSFKEAVFEVENAYYSNKLSKTEFDNKISFQINLINSFITSRDLIYDYPDKENVKKCAAIFSIMTDTIPILLKNDEIGYHIPFSYDFNDIWGHQNWTNMFVTKLLETKKGNCHSLPFLYKILADEIGVKAHISVAPNHFYIKHQNKANGWYNTELTSGMFPIDGWLMASGYIHLDAIVNQLYMQALNDKQMIALCLIDLAKGYEKKLGSDANSDFILKCCDTTLKYFPNYINALILKAETKKKIFEALMARHQATYPSQVLNLPEAESIFNDMTVLYSKIHELGYRKMPEEMYLNWLVSLKEERNKYENKKITNFNTKSE